VIIGVSLDSDGFALAAQHVITYYPKESYQQVFGNAWYLTMISFETF